MPTIWTIGHSTHTFERFLDLLRGHEIHVLADVRRFPTSKRHPEYDRPALAAALAGAGVEYRWIEDLGGRREPRWDSRNIALRDDAFRGYADHMESPAFAAALNRLLAAAAGRRVVVMCAEADWRHCHRSLLSDALSIRGATVMHITATGEVEPHALNPQARRDGETLIYAPAESQPTLPGLFD